MSITRRDFIKLGSLSAFVAFGVPNPTFGRVQNFDSAEYQNMLLSQRRIGDFENQIGSNFQLTKENVTNLAILTEVKNSQDKRVFNRGEENFSLVFSLPPDTNIMQATYMITHPALGSFPLFLVPGKCPADNPLLIAVINRRAV